MDRIRVLLAEDHAVVREGTRRILESDATIAVVGEAADGAEAVDLASDLAPDVVLLDMALPVLNGIEATQRLRRLTPRPVVLLLSAYDDEDYVHAALEAGASGYLLKTAHAVDVIAAIHAAAHGEVVLSPTVAHKLIARGRDRDRDRQLLSDREMEVLRLVARGTHNHEIAQLLALSTRTVEGHLTSIFNKLGVGSRTEAIVQAAARGLLRIEQRSDVEG